MLEKEKRPILERIDVTVTAIAVWFNELFIEKAPREDYELLRHVDIYTTEVKLDGYVYFVSCYYC